MKKILTTVGKKNIIIISGILLVGIAIYLNLNLSFIEDYYLENERDRLGQASLVDNLNVIIDNDSGFMVDGITNENMGFGAAGGMNVDMDIDADADIETLIDIEDLNFVHEAQDNYFAITVVSRQRARDETLELLEAVASHVDSTPESRNRALSDIATIAREIEREANIETLVRAKGFAECVAVVSGDLANIIVRTDGLMPNEIAQIKEIAFEQAGILPRNVRIIERN